ncbi:MAG: hypothetical protein ACLR0I_06900 [Streptococcus salivarius]
MSNGWTSQVDSPVDHYNKYGFCFAKTTHDENGQALFTSYQTKEGDERILEIISPVIFS